MTFNNSMTKGLDPTYDAGLLRGSSGISLYTRLVEDNGVDFAIQCLPENFGNLIIPLGVDSKNGGEITFSAETMELPAAWSVTLEDKTTGTLTSLKDNVVYKAIVAAGSSGMRRFYLHVHGIESSVPQTTGTSGIKAYLENGLIVVVGEVSSTAKGNLFDMSGRKLATFSFKEGSCNVISAGEVATGVYLLTVVDGTNSYTTKVVQF